MKILVETNQLLTANDNTPVTRPACTEQNAEVNEEEETEQNAEPNEGEEKETTGGSFSIQKH